MAGIIKTEKQIENIREACRLVANLLQEIGEEKIKPGTTLTDIETFAREWIKKHKVTPSFLGWHGYKHATCLSVNDCIIHGVPSERELHEGDIIGVDCGIIYKGGYSDHAITFPVGNVTAPVKKLLSVTKQSLIDAINAMGPNKRVSEVGRVVEHYGQKHNYGIVQEYCGHGVGLSVWEDPKIPNYVSSTHGPRVRSNMVVAIEPMINMGGSQVKVLDDQWSVATLDGSLGAHFEHTVLITETGTEILTLPG